MDQSGPHGQPAARAPSLNFGCGVPPAAAVDNSIARPCWAAPNANPDGPAGTPPAIHSTGSIVNLPSQEDLQFVAAAVSGGLALVALMAWGISAMQRRSDRIAEREQLAARYRDAEAGETR